MLKAEQKAEEREKKQLKDLKDAEQKASIKANLKDWDKWYDQLRSEELTS